MPSFFIHTLGCKVNGYESSAVAETLKQHGFDQVNKPENVDLAILNTCSVTSTADQKSRQHISRYRKATPNGVVLVMGCHSQHYADNCIEKGADIVLGTTGRDEILSLYETFLKERTPINKVQRSVRNEEYEELGDNAYTEAARAYLKIQDGCDNFCSYCTIPALRGNSRSRRSGEVIREARSLVEKGYREIILSGIHIGGYGKDLGDGSYRFSDLVENILINCPTLERLRISSIEESEIDHKLIELYRNNPILVDHIHIPLQSGSSSVLMRMRRKYDEEAFVAKLDALRSVRPDIAITTDVIVGFPEESEEEFLETMRTCERCGFAEIHVFPFSSRPGTYASTLKDIDPKIKKERVHHLMELSKKLRLQYEERFYGKSMRVIFEEYDEKEHLAYGHTSNYLLVGISSELPLHGSAQNVVYGPQVASD